MPNYADNDYRTKYRRIISYLNQRPGTRFNGYYFPKGKVIAFVLLLRQICEKMREGESFRCQIIVEINWHFCGIDFIVQKDSLRVFLLDAIGNAKVADLLVKLETLSQDDDMIKYSRYIPTNGTDNQIQYDGNSCFWITLKCLLELSKLDNYFDKLTKQQSRTFSDLPPQLAVMLKPLQRVNIAEWESIKAYGDRMRSVATAAVAITPNAALAAQSFQGQTVIQAFEYVVQQVPQNIAVTYENQHLTYEQLNAKANQLTNFIRSQYSPNYGERIGICLQSKLDTVIVILAVLKLGCVYVPLDPTYPADRIHVIVQDSQSNFIIVESKTINCLPAGYKNICNLHANQSEIEAQSTQFISSCSNPNDIIYIVYTSGSTGRPKGVVVTHKTVSSNVENYTNYLEIKASDNILQLASLSHTAAVDDLFGALLNGARLVLINKDSIPQVTNIITQNRITIYHSIPHLFRMIFSEVVSSSLQSLRVVLLGGDTLSYEDFALYQRLVESKIVAGNCVLINSYGASEISWALQYRMDLTTKIDPTQPLPVGKPVTNVEAILVDKQLNCITELNKVGEIAICSEHLVQGYLDLPEQTKKAFREINGKRYYLTGDLAVMLPGGVFGFRGRKVGYVKIRGTRIYLHEIEYVVKNHPAVAECAVTTYETKADTALAAYVVRKQSITIGSQKLREYLQRNLEANKIPDQIIFTLEVPKLFNGKINKPGLQKEAQEGYDQNNFGVFSQGMYVSEERYQADAIEIQIAEILKQVIDRPINKTAGTLSFTNDLKSLEQMALLARVNARFNTALNLNELIKCNIISRLADYIRANQGKSMQKPENYSDVFYGLITANVKPRSNTTLLEYLQARTTDNVNNTIEHRKIKWRNAAANVTPGMPNDFQELFALSKRDEFANLLFCLVFPEHIPKTPNRINVDSINLTLIRDDFSHDFLILLVGSSLTTCKLDFIFRLFEQCRINSSLSYDSVDEVCMEAISKRNFEFLEYFYRYKRKDMEAVLPVMLLDSVLCDNAADIAWPLYSWWPFVKTFILTHRGVKFIDNIQHQVPVYKISGYDRLTDVIEQNSTKLPKVYQAFKIWKYSSLRAFSVIKSTYYFATFVDVGKIKISCGCLSPDEKRDEQVIDISHLTKKFPFQRKLLAFSNDASTLALLQEEGTLVWLNKSHNRFGVRYVSEVDLSGEPTCIACAFDDPLNICGIVAIGYGHGNEIDIYQVRNGSLNKQAEISIKNPTCLTFIGSKNPHLAVGNLNGNVAVYRHNNWISPGFTCGAPSGVIESICFEEESSLLRFVTPTKFLALNVETCVGQRATLPARKNPILLSGSMVFCLDDAWRDVAAVKSVAEFAGHTEEFNF